MNFRMSHKNINRLVFAVIVIFIAIYYFNTKVNSPEECKKIAGKWNEQAQTCEQTLSQLIYENLSDAHPLTMAYPEGEHQVVLDKKEVIAETHYLRGHYQIVLKEAEGDNEALYDRGSLYLNMSKMQILSEDKNKPIYFAAPFVMNTAGSGVFVYVGLFSYDIRSQKSEHLDSFLLGDRIREEKIASIKDYIQIDYKDYAKGQSFSDSPTQLKSVSLLINNLQFEGQPASFQVVKRMHQSWDVNKDGMNDCELDGSCDHTVDYTSPRKAQ